MIAETEIETGMFPSFFGAGMLVRFAVENAKVVGPDGIKVGVSIKAKFLEEHESRLVEDALNLKFDSDGVVSSAFFYKIQQELAQYASLQP